MAKRADNNDGSLTEILSGKHAGKWRVQFTQVDDSGKRQRLSRLFPNKTAGKDFLHDLRQGRKVEAARRSKELTLAGWFDWLVEHEWPNQIAEVTIATRKSRFNNYVRKTWGGVPLAKLDAVKVRAFYVSLREDGVGEPTVLAIKRDLVRVFNQAKSPFQRVSVNAANPFALTVPTPPEREAVALSPEVAMKALREKKLDPSRRAMLGLYLLGGVRLGEQMAMTKGQLLFDQDLIFVDRAVRVGPTGKQEVGLPKKDKKRIAVMCPSLKALLLPVVEGLADGDYLWSAQSGNRPRTKKVTYTAWRSILDDTKLPAEMTPQDCRLSHANWIEKLMPEVSETTFKEHIGHAGEGVSQIHYSRPLTSAQKILRDNIERLATGSKRKAS